MSYCDLCGDTGLLLDGSVCECRSGIDSVYDSVDYVDIPEQYRDLMFNKALVTQAYGDIYVNYLNKLYEDISSTRFKFKNVIVCSKPGSSKTILAYSCISNLFRKKIKVCKLYDVLEISSLLSVANMEYRLIVSVPYLFVRVPMSSEDTMFANMAVLVDKRVRNGASTIFLYNGVWNSLAAKDTYKQFCNLQGDGSFCSVKVDSFSIK
ncbi:MAG: hypothetical protein LBS29_04445 [Endomicrobium sp.]|jgi:hypothetical protein|nr:hypothetical protein [Endomicrobium sp.]